MTVERAERTEKSESSGAKTNPDLQLRTEEGLAIIQNQERSRAAATSGLPELEITSPGTEDKQYFEDKSQGVLKKDELEERLKHPELFDKDTYAMMQALNENFDQVSNLVNDGKRGITDADMKAMRAAMDRSEMKEEALKGQQQWSRKDARLNENNYDSITEAEMDRRLADPKRYDPADRSALEAVRSMQPEIQNQGRINDNRPGISQQDLGLISKTDERALEQQAARTGVYAPDNANRLDSTDIAPIAERINQREQAEERRLREDGEDIEKDTTPDSLTRKELDERLAHPEKYSADELKVLQAMDKNFDQLSQISNDGKQGISERDMSEFNKIATDLDNRRQNVAFVQKNFNAIDSDGDGSLSYQEVQNMPQTDERAKAASKALQNNFTGVTRGANYDNTDGESRVSNQDLHAWVAELHKQKGALVDQMDKGLK